MPAVIKCKIDDSIKTLFVYVNYSKDEVYFPHNPELECEELRLAVLRELDKSANVEVPEIPANVIEQLREIGSTKKNVKFTKFD